MANGDFQDALKRIREAENAREQAEQAAMLAQLEAYIAFLEPFVEASAVSALTDEQLLAMYTVLQNAWNYLSKVENSKHRKKSSAIDRAYGKLKSIVSKVFVHAGKELAKRGLVWSRDKKTKLEELLDETIPPFYPDDPPKDP